MQGANLANTRFQGVLFWNTHLQGIESGFDFVNFLKQIDKRIGKKSDLSAVSKSTLSIKEEDIITKSLRYIYRSSSYRYWYIKDAIERIKKSTKPIPNLNWTLIGIYNKKEVQRWLKEYYNR